MILDDLTTNIHAYAQRTGKRNEHRQRSAFGLIQNGQDFTTTDGRGIVYRDGRDWCAERDERHAICTSLKDAARFAKTGRA